MKNIIILSILLAVFAGCKKNKTTPVPENADVTIKFNNKVNGQPVEYGKYQYTNAAGNLFSITLLKYYISNVILVTDDNKEVKLNNYDLINAFESAGFSTVDAKNLPNGNYKNLQFGLGVDKGRNHSGAQDGDLDPIHNMIWTWATGYLFMKHEGKFINTVGDTIDLQYHLGTDDAYTTINVPINMVVNGEAKTLNIDFDLNSMYDLPVINFNDGAIRHSTNIMDLQWINDMRINAQDAFKFGSVQ